MKIPQNRVNDIAVEQVTFFNDIVSIDYYLPEWDECKTLDVPAEKYEAHLNDIEALNWSFMVFKGNEYVDDEEGTMTMAQYFQDVDWQDKNKDAVSYIKANCVDYEGLPDVFGAIAAIAKPNSPNPNTYKTVSQSEIINSMPAEQIPAVNMSILGSGQPESEFNVNQ